MAKKRKSDATRLDEVDRSMYTTFCSAANSLSQLYTQSMNNQRLSFQTGERHALGSMGMCHEEIHWVLLCIKGLHDMEGIMEKLYQWVLRQQEEGSRVTTVDIVAYLQNELEYGADEPPMSPRLPFQNQHSQNAMHPSNLGAPGSFSPLGISVVGQGVRTGQSDNQAKNSVFSNALSSPVRRSIQSYQLSQVGYHSNHISSYGNGPRNNETNPSNLQNRDTNSPSSNDCMDMHADSPGHDYSY
ncbi:hypothetical protein CJ030_MR6G025426 [Morella rubra]|uniref:Uncharacterized protein n=1 Tax=Morella rubra TaxID=262757 RepID=A0A6A1VD18_9ROSI|nr:hypothetical protein CJ030_MR6G025426 [Morella rubra]